MPRLDVDDDLGSWLMLRPEMGAGLGALSTAVYDKSVLPLREREMARMRIALANECEVCRNTRDALGEAAGVDEALYEHVPEWRTWPGYSERERLAAEFAERFASDHLGLRDDDDFWNRIARGLHRPGDRRPRHLLRAVARVGPPHARARRRADVLAAAARQRRHLTHVASLRAVCHGPVRAGP